MDAIKKWAVYTIRERAGLEKAIWVRVGIGFLNRDGSFNLHLDATPLDGKLHMREWRDENQQTAFPATGGRSNGKADPSEVAPAEAPF